MFDINIDVRFRTITVSVSFVTKLLRHKMLVKLYYF